MDLEEKTIRRFSVIFLLVILAILAFLLLKPLLLSIISGLILAYVFLPVFKKINKFIKNKTICAILITLLVLIIILVPLWFIVPILFKQGFEVFRYLQTVNVDIHKVVIFLFPTATEQFSAQLTVTISSIVSKASAAFLGYLANTFIEIPTFILNTFITGFIFFYGLKEGEKFADFIRGLSPLSKSKEELIERQFRDITYSVIYGQFIVGLIQGVLASIGLFMFGVPNALVLSIIVIFLSILPLIGPFFVWVPVASYLFATASVGTTIGYLLYNIIIVSTADNIMRSYIVAKAAKISNAIVFVGMLGGLFLFGIIGVLLGPLILAYFITFIEAYKEKSFSSLFFEDKK